MRRERVLPQRVQFAGGPLGELGFPALELVAQRRGQRGAGEPVTGDAPGEQTDFLDQSGRRSGRHLVEFVVEAGREPLGSGADEVRQPHVALEQPSQQVHLSLVDQPHQLAGPDGTAGVGLGTDRGGQHTEQLDQR
jgi:hypothetical protein